MKTLSLKELYAEVMASEALKKEYFAAANDKNVTEFLRAHGCEATEQELNAFLSNPENLPQGELADDELDAVAGGTCYKDGRPVVTVMNGCEYWTCDKCKVSSTVNYYTARGSLSCTRCSVCGSVTYCMHCEYCHYEDALWQCYNPKRHNN